MDVQELRVKYQRLVEYIKGYSSVLIAYSGGLDSSFLSAISAEALGKENVYCITARSETYPVSEYEDAVRFARLLGLNHTVIETSELAIENFKENPPNRCYYCKSELFAKLLTIAKTKGIEVVFDGSNADDVQDFRPGMKAASEFNVKSPLKESGLKKNEIRFLAKERDYIFWDKPSFACLSSRFPYGEEITEDKVKRVDEGERFIRELGFRQVRLRSEGNTARIELEADSIVKLLDNSELRLKIVDRLKSLGYIYVTLDLEGYRQGSMNESLKRHEL